MLQRRFLLEVVGFIAAAAMCAAVANGLAARTRQLSWKADYPNAMKVTRRVAPPVETPLPTVVPAPFAPVTQPAPAAARPLETSTAVPSPTPAVTPTPAPNAAVAVATPAPAAQASPTPKPQKVFAPHPDRPYIEITPADVQELYERKALFIDARRTDDYEAGHIAGARSMPVWESDVDQRVAALYDEGRNQQDPIVIYCSGGNCEDSHMLSQKLWGLGFDNVLVYRDGFPDWVRRGGAVTKGGTP